MDQAGISGRQNVRHRIPRFMANNPRDMYYWYYGSLAMFQLGGDYWDEWNEAMKKALCKNQQNKRSLCLFGSWDPQGTIWGEDIGGRCSAAQSCTPLQWALCPAMCQDPPC